MLYAYRSVHPHAIVADDAQQRARVNTAPRHALFDDDAEHPARATTTP